MAFLRKRIRCFLNDRFPMAAVRTFVGAQMHKRLPPHTGWWHVFGSLSLMLFVNQVVTGVLLLLYYRPTPEEAFKSIQYLHADVSFGWLFRQLHAWGATLMIVAVLVHMGRTFFMGAYKKPRELTWVVGVVIAIATITFGFSGYLLPWSQVSYWATTVGTEIAGAIPGVGPALRTVMLGGPTVGRETLSRFFTLHAVALPWLMALLVVVHLALMRTQNLATLEPVGQERGYPPESGIPFWPVHLAKEGCVALAIFGLLVTLAIVAPWEIGEPADPLSTPAGVKPEWYFLPSYQLLKYFTGHGGKVLGILVAGVPFLLLFVWPFLDRSKARHPRHRPVAVTIGVAAIILAVGMGIVGHLSETRRTVFGVTIEFDILGRPSLVETGGRPATGNDPLRGQESPIAAAAERE